MLVCSLKFLEWKYNCKWPHLICWRLYKVAVPQKIKKGATEVIFSTDIFQSIFEFYNGKNGKLRDVLMSFKLELKPSPVDCLIIGYRLRYFRKKALSFPRRSTETAFFRQALFERAVSAKLGRKIGLWDFQGKFPRMQASRPSRLRREGLFFICTWPPDDGNIWDNRLHGEMRIRLYVTERRWGRARSG